MSVFHNNVLAGAAGAGGAAGGGFKLEKSVRFNQADSAGLYKNFSSAGNRRTWTFSCWVKKSGLYSDNSYQTIFESGVAKGAIQFDSIDQLRVYDGQSGGATVEANSVSMRDTSAWYHIVVKYDTTQSTASDRVVIYSNGVDITSTTATFPSQNYESAFNNTQNHYVGRGTSGNYLHGYLADVYFIDGTAHDATDFGEYDDNGVWQCKAFSGSFGSNGFHLFDFANESGIGNDSSGNDNDFTVNNISAVTTNGSYTGGISVGNYTLTGYDKNDVVDGDLSGSFYADRPINNNGLNFTSIPEASTSVRIRAQLESGTLTTNGGDIATGSTNNQWLTVSTTYPFTLTYIRASGGNSSDGFFIYAIEVDGTVLVDNRYGTGDDVLRDVPTNGDSSNDTGAGGELSSNYCVMNPLDSASGVTLSNGNLEYSASTSSDTSKGTIGVSSGKWYWEVKVTKQQNGQIGIADAGHSLTSYVGNTATSYSYHIGNGQVYNNGGGTTVSGFSGTSEGDIIGVALDLDSSTTTLAFYKNGSLMGTAFSGISGTFFPALSRTSGTGAEYIVNFGQRAFAYGNAGTNRPAATFKALCTSNLPTPDIPDGSDHFLAKAYTGNGSTKSISTGFSPGFVWLKHRVDGEHHGLFDTQRGALMRLVSDYTYASTSRANSLTSFNSDGFSLGSAGEYNGNNESHIAWAWKVPTSFSNSAGSNGASIASSGKVNQSAGFSIVQWTGTGAAGTVGHGLNAKPEFIFSHRISGTGQWPVYHSANGATHYQYLNSSIEARDYQHFWNDTEPTSSVFSVGSDSDVSANGGTHIAYCISPVAGYSAVGSYAGNGSSDGSFVYLGFRPRWILLKNKTNSYSWYIYDTARAVNNVAKVVLIPNAANGDATDADYSIDILSNGFKARTNNIRSNASSNTYIYVAFAENPFQANGGLAR